jgi:hypothetical protein
MLEQFPSVTAVVCSISFLVYIRHHLGIVLCIFDHSYTSPYDSVNKRAHAFILIYTPVMC